MSLQIKERTQPRVYLRDVYFLGSTAVTKGEGVCYDRDVGTAANNDGKRDKDVQVPDNTNNYAFAGVAIRDYSAVTGGQWITIYEPGSVCLALIKETTTTIGDRSFVTCLATGADAGKFTTDAGFMGRGTAKVLQTLAAAGLALVELLDGEESGLAQIIPTATLTAGGAQTNFLIGGKTIFEGPATPATDVTATQADGTFPGQKKIWKLSGALTTNDVLITVTSGVQLDGSTALATIELDGDGDHSVLEYSGEPVGGWRLMHNNGSALA